MKMIERNNDELIFVLIRIDFHRLQKQRIQQMQQVLIIEIDDDDENGISIIIINVENE